MDDKLNDIITLSAQIEVEIGLQKPDLWQIKQALETIRTIAFSMDHSRFRTAASYHRLAKVWGEDAPPTCSKCDKAAL